MNQELIELWKDIPNYQGLYSVSSLGKVKRIRGKSCLSDRFCSQFLNSRGYFKVVLSKEDKTKNHLVHRLVAQSFINNPDSLPVINHINANQLDNNVSNLEWCTQKANIQKYWAEKRAKERLKLYSIKEFIHNYKNSLK